MVRGVDGAARSKTRWRIGALNVVARRSHAAVVTKTGDSHAEDWTILIDEVENMMFKLSWMSEMC